MSAFGSDGAKVESGQAQLPLSEVVLFKPRITLGEMPCEVTTVPAPHPSPNLTTALASEVFIATIWHN